MRWLNYYMPADIKTMLNNTAKWLRKRIRMCLWKSWKNIKCRYDNLRRLGLDDDTARKFSNSRKGYWRIAGSHILTRTVTNPYIALNLGLIDPTKYYLKLRNV
ncbi:MAG: RNA-directed DNA polymerase (reverse transcriptase) [uncultured bacterium]|nr:MAG: RNA-directed DNA polymerase (reverse transcriptase) [uncultured bacterium]